MANAIDVESLDISNFQGVSSGPGDGIGVIAPSRMMTRERALVHAAWLVALAADDDDFPAILERVRNT